MKLIKSKKRSRLSSSSSKASFPSSQQIDHLMISMFLKRNGISDLTSVVPSVQHFLPWIVIHHGVVAILVGELYVGVPLSSRLRVISKVDCGESAGVAVNGVDHSTSNKSISHGSYRFYKYKRKCISVISRFYTVLQIR